ncbi:MAG TPA: hypothetical protein VG206_13160 [Terriglobia bacterium]|nr:hypothetical protein [Terriglobia bacterium]
MHKNGTVLPKCFLVLLVCCGSGWADFKYTQSSKITGGAMAGMMKVAGVFSKQARQAREPMVSTEYVKGRKMRRDESAGQSTIIDLEGRQIINIDSQKHTYSVMTFDQMRQVLEEQKAMVQQQMAKENKGKPQQANLKITPKLSVTDGSATPTILGLQAREVKVDLEMLMEASDPNQPAQSGQVQTWVKSDQYVTPSLPGSEQIREFEQALAKELDWLPGQVFGGNPQVSMSMTELQKNSASVQGFPLLQYISMGLGAPGQPNATSSNAGSGQQQPQQQSSNSSDVSNPGAAAVKSVGKMLGGFHRKKKDQDQSSSEGASQSAPPPPSQPGSLMEMTVEVTSFSTDSLDGSLFSPPAGYTQVAPNLEPAQQH